MIVMPSPFLDGFEAVVTVPVVEPERIEPAIADIGEVSFGAPYPADVIEEILRGTFDAAAYTEADEQRYADLQAMDDPRARDLLLSDMQAIALFEAIELMPLFLRGAA